MSGAARRDPFSVTADPDAYVPRPAAEAALRALEEALRAGRRSVALSGPPGIGKTMLLRVLERRLADVARSVYLPYAALDFEDLCTWVLGVLDLPMVGDPAARLLAAARAEMARGRFLLVMMDDASALTSEAARRWVALSEEAEGAVRLLAVPVDDGRAGRVLAALGDELVVVRFSAPLEADETAAFVRGRLGHAGAEADVVARFDEATLERLHGAAAGNPRRLQRLATQRLRRDAHPVLLADPDDPEPALRSDAGAHGDDELRLEVDEADALLPADRGPAQRHEYDTPLPVFAPAAARAEAWAGEEEGASPAEPATPVPEPDAAREAAHAREPIRRPEPVERPVPLLSRFATSAASAHEDAPREAAQKAEPAPPPHAAPPAPAGEALPTRDEALPAEAPRASAPHAPVLLVPRRRGGIARLLLAAATGTALGVFAAWLLLGAPDLTPVAMPEPVVPPAETPVARTEPPPGLEVEPPIEPSFEPPAAGAAERGSEPEPAPAALAPDPVPVHINAVPWARVFVDGREIGITPLADVPVEPGARHFRAELPDGTVLERDVVVDETTRHLSFAPPAPDARPAGSPPR